MARWHRSSCSKPQVLVCGELPFCTNCESLAPDDIAEHPQPLSVGPPTPRTSSQFNLSWPAAVQYLHVPNVSSDTLTAPSPQHNSALATLTSSENGEISTDLISVPEVGSKGDARAPTCRSVIYSVLDNQQSIRLLCLEPGSPSDPIHGFFVPMDLQSSGTLPEYDAVSYTWADTSGDMQRRQPVFLGLHWDVLQVTNNCAAVLRRVRQVDGRRLVWVDAICINQDDEAERSSQVQLMRVIYARASRVLVYLGDDDFEDRDLALSLLSEWDYSNIFRPYHHSKQLTTTPRRYGTQLKQKNTARVDDIRARAALNRLLASPYFQRLWVVQEFVSAQAVQVYCGTGVAPWPLSGLDEHQGIQAAVHTHPDSAPFTTSTTSSSRREAPWVRYRDIKAKISADHLWDILLDTSRCLCSDRRDKVFAVLGLINNWNGRPVLADYSRTTKEVYIGIAAYLGQVTGRYRDVLKLAAVQRDSTSSAPRGQLPSWVPDWSAVAGNLDRFYSHSSATDRYAASPFNRFLSLSPPSGHTVGVGVRSDNGSLCLHATRLCTLREYFTFDNAEDYSWTYRGAWTEPRRCVKLVMPQIPVGGLDGLFWLHGIRTFAILRRGDRSMESQSYSLIAVGDLVFSFTPLPLRLPPAATRSPVTTSARSSGTRLKGASSTAVGDGESLSVKRTIRSFRPTEKHHIVGYFSSQTAVVPETQPPEALGQGPTEDQFRRTYHTLLDALTCIKLGLVHSEIALWRVWNTMDKALSWVFRDPTVMGGLLETLKGLTRLSLDPGASKSSFLSINGEYISGSAVTAISKLAWWKMQTLKARRLGARNTNQIPSLIFDPCQTEQQQQQQQQHTDQKTGNNSVKTLLSKLYEWAEVTENLMRVFQENTGVMQRAGDQGHRATTRAFSSNPPGLWRHGWQELQIFAQQEMLRKRNPMTDLDAEQGADLELAIALLEVLSDPNSTISDSAKSRPSGSNMLFDVDETEQPTTPHRQPELLKFLRENWDLTWDEDVFRRVMNSRAEIWNRFLDLDKERGWSRGMFSYNHPASGVIGLHISELDEQISIHAEMRMMGLDFDNVEEITIQ